MMKKILFLLCLTGTFFTSCHYLDDVAYPVISNCDENAIEDATRFSQISTANYHIDNVVLNGDCLEVTISSSGCHPDNWEMNLVGAKSLAAVSPPDVGIKVELINNDACLAVFQKTVSFDITPLQFTGQSQVRLVIDGWNNPILYQY